MSELFCAQAANESVDLAQTQRAKMQRAHKPRLSVPRLSARLSVSRLSACLSVPTLSDHKRLGPSAPRLGLNSPPTGRLSQLQTLRTQGGGGQGRSQLAAHGSALRTGDVLSAGRRALNGLV